MQNTTPLVCIVDDLDFDFAQAALWFQFDQSASYQLVQVSDEHAKLLADNLGLAVRRCYVNDSTINERAKALDVDKTEIIAARLPDAGATMAGDFGEILVYFYHSAKELPRTAFGPKKWRLKQDRTKPAPHSDVIHFVLPMWPESSADDVLLCSEVKVKSTDAPSTPIKNAIEDCEKDRTSRLARTLVWLRERALLEPIGDVKIAHLDRFIKASEHPPASKRFHAVAVICKSLIDEELKSAPTTASPEYTLIVIVVPDLKDVYHAVFDAAQKALPRVSHEIPAQKSVIKANEE
ncbi:DUF1837 domain-containing protein [Azospirillum sp. YIM B02556]|uniref:DUF1837 domain-containing protein n=1 Tax=Azospirillum endophyticum TaxID=2800326 RepID=A0ABS1FE30_9PROT|nr:Hachiman antiphage defense system protein HamA [Azospirillum endophyticum]MBK1841659.1 DUF1837 domain-containing protein [Azospirillum endophyticum]